MGGRTGTEVVRLMGNCQGLRGNGVSPTAAPSHPHGWHDAFARVQGLLDVRAVCRDEVCKCRDAVHGHPWCYCRTFVFAGGWYFLVPVVPPPALGLCAFPCLLCYAPCPRQCLKDPEIPVRFMAGSVLRFVLRNDDCHDVRSWRQWCDMGVLLGAMWSLIVVPLCP